MDEDDELEILLALDGYSYEAAAGYVVEFVVRRVKKTAARPHGIRYALVFRPKRGTPYVRFDNAHAVDQPGGRFVKRKVASIIGTEAKAIRAAHMLSPRRCSSLMTSGVR